MSIVININAPELVGAIQALAAALAGGRISQVPAQISTPTQTPEFQTNVLPFNVFQAPAPQMPPAQTAVPMAQYQQPMQQAPAPQTPPMQAAVPTTPQTYTLEQLAVAATPLADAGKRQDLVNLLAQFGVTALTHLPKEHYGAFATQLRAMGAKL